VALTLFVFVAVVFLGAVGGGFLGTAVSGLLVLRSVVLVGAAVGGLWALQLVVCGHCSRWFVGAAVGGLLAL